MMDIKSLDTDREPLFIREYTILQMAQVTSEYREPQMAHWDEQFMIERVKMTGGPSLWIHAFNLASLPTVLTFLADQGYDMKPALEALQQACAGPHEPHDEYVRYINAWEQGMRETLKEMKP